MAAFDLRDLRFRWPGPGAHGLAVRSLTIAQGESVFLRGESGSGKSTALGLLSGVLSPESGTITALGRDLGRMSSAARDRFRADHVGYLFQQFNLVPYLSVIENVLLPCRFSKVRRERACRDGATARDEAVRLLGRLDIADGLLARTSVQLSVGQQQRVAAARALIGAPEIILADEPTSALDANRQAAFLDLLRVECAGAGASLVFASHDLRLSERFDRVVDVATLSA